jgi:hypothetical protein
MYNKILTWKLNGYWNLDIYSNEFDKYLSDLQKISESLDSYKSNLISRFLITGSFKEFDTPDQKVEKILQIYGRSFDEVKKFIDALANMNSVNYVVANDIPSQLLTNLAQTLGLNPNISPITNESFLTSVFNPNGGQIYKGQSKPDTPTELNYQYYRNLILNASYMFKSKGTRKSIEYIMRFIGAPDALLEFNEIVYLADSKISIDKFKGAVIINPIDSSGKKRVWRQTKPSLKEAVKRGDIVIKKNRDKYTVLMKDRIKEGRKPKTIWIDPSYDASSHGTVLLQKILVSITSVSA